MKNIFVMSNFKFIRPLSVSILALSILMGQLIKIPPAGLGGVILLDIIVFAFFIGGIFKLNFKLNLFPIGLKSFLAFILVGFISLLFSPLNLTIEEKIFSSFYLIRLLLYSLFAVVVFSKSFKNLLANIPLIWLYSGVGLSVLGILQLILIPNLKFLEDTGWDPHIFRVVSTFLDPNFLAAYLTLCLITLYDNSILKLGKNIRIIFAVVIFLAILGTFSRSAFLMLGVSSIVLAILNRSLKLIGLILTLSIILFLGVLIYNQILAKPNGIDRNVSANLRLESWSEGLTLIQRSPVLGIGFNSYRYALREFNLAPKKVQEGRAASGNDSSLLFVTATTGIIGLVIYVSFLAGLFRKGLTALKNDIPFSKAYLAGLLGLIFNSLFINSLFYPAILLWILLGYIYLSAKTSS